MDAYWTSKFSWACNLYEGAPEAVKSHAKESRRSRKRTDHPKCLAGVRLLKLNLINSAYAINLTVLMTVEACGWSQSSQVFNTHEYECSHSLSRALQEAM